MYFDLSMWSHTNTHDEHYKDKGVLVHFLLVLVIKTQDPPYPLNESRCKNTKWKDLFVWGHDYNQLKKFPGLGAKFISIFGSDDVMPPLLHELSAS